MSERLAQMTEESIQEGGRGTCKALEEAGFSQELEMQLETPKIQDSTFKSSNPAAFAQANMPTSAGRGTREQAAAQPWAGIERLSDSALRMLNDAHKPLRVPRTPKTPQPSPPMSVDMRMKKAVQKSQGERLANARDRMSVYALSQDPNISEKEREELRKILKERFTSGARPMPGSVQGLAALANERIEDAIARGQFKNIARGTGKNVERDHNASSPFLDTTEYFMNKIIQKQEIVPPWIEKQQELVKAAARFRGRLRTDWKRHAARMIASEGGPLEAQVRRAERYAAAEAAENPKAVKVEAISEIDSEGKLSQVTVKETPTLSSTSQASTITVSEDLASNSPPKTEFPSPAETQLPSPSPQLPVHISPFRDLHWQALEQAYHTLAMTDLNNRTRSYNLQAPDLAKKPYFNLDRELRSCFADVAPQVPGEIRERARKPQRIRVETIGHRPGGVLEGFGGERVKVYDSTRPNYG